MTRAASRAFVTGGSGGIGAAIVRALASSGFDVLFTYRRSTDAAALLTEELRAAYGVAIENRALDLGDRDAVEEALRFLDHQEPFDVYVHNAGMPYDTLAALIDQGRAELVMQVNFWAFSRLAGGLLKPMMRRKTGRIVAVGSVAALRGSAGNAPYSASKAALLGYVRSLAVEVARKGVTANYVAPGFVDTEMLTPYASVRGKIEPQIPAGRFATPDEIANAVAFLASPAAAYINGAVLPVDGGLSAALGISR